MKFQAQIPTPWKVTFEKSNRGGVLRTPTVSKYSESAVLQFLNILEGNYELKVECHEKYFEYNFTGLQIILLYC